MMASVSSEGRESRWRVRARAQLDQPGRHLRPRHHAEAAAHLDDLERAALVARSALVQAISTSVAGRAAPTAAPSTSRMRGGLHRRVGGEEQGLDDVDGLGHAGSPSGLAHRVIRLAGGHADRDHRCRAR